MEQLNVNPADLLKAPDDYTDLAARAALLSPQALAEVNRVVDTHGPMGYPAAVGIAAGLATRDAPVHAKAHQFVQYAQRLTGHALTYAGEDTAAEARLNALTFPEPSTTAACGNPPTIEQCFRPDQLVR